MNHRPKTLFLVLSSLLAAWLSMWWISGWSSDSVGDSHVEGVSGDDATITRQAPVDLDEGTGAEFSSRGVRSPFEAADQAEEARQAARIFGKVLEDTSGDPLPGAQLEILDRGRGALHTLVSDATGSFDLPAGLPSLASFHIVISKDGYGRLVARGLRVSTDPLEFRLAGELVIRGQVVATPDDLPVPSFRVIAVRVPSDDNRDGRVLHGLHALSIPDQLAVTCEIEVSHKDGEFELRGLREGKYALMVFAEGFAPTFFNGGGRSYEYGKGVLAAEPEAVEPIRIRLLEMGAVYVRVLDAETGHVVENASVCLAAQHGRRLFDSPRATGVLEANGSLRVPVSVDERGRVKVTYGWVSAPGYAASRIGFSGQKTGFTFTVELGRGGRVRGTVLDDDGEPVVAAGIFVKHNSSGALRGSARTDSMGSFEIGPLEAGVLLTLYCLDPGLDRVLCAVPLQLDHGELRTIEIGGSSGDGVVGRVTLLGEPCQNVHVYLDPHAGRGDTVMFPTGADGRFRFGGLSPGEHDLSVGVTEGDVDIEETRTLTYTRGRRIEENFDFRRRVRGSVVDASTGEPLGDEETVIIGVRSASNSRGRKQTKAWMKGEGHFEVYVVEAGFYDLVLVRADGYSMQALRVDLASSDAVDDVVLRLEPLGSMGELTIRVEDAETKAAIDDGHVRWVAAGWDGVSLFDEGVVFKDELDVGVLHCHIESRDHVPARLEIEITPKEGPQTRTVSLQRSNSVRITQVTPGGRGRRAGLEAGDIVIACGAEPVLNHSSLRRAVAGVAVDRFVELHVLRQGTELTLSIRGGALRMEMENWRRD